MIGFGSWFAPQRGWLYVHWRDHPRESIVPYYEKIWARYWRREKRLWNCK